MVVFAVTRLSLAGRGNLWFYSSFRKNLRGATIFGGGTWERMRERLCDQDDANLPQRSLEPAGHRREEKLSARF
jgi:hypothetical protein